MNKVLSEEEIEKILKKLRPQPYSYYWSAVVGLMAYAGLRDNEVIELLCKDIDLKAGLIRVSSNDDDQNNREIPISTELRIILEKAPQSRSQYRFPNIEANSKQWFKKSFNVELKKRLPKDIEGDDLSNSFQSVNL